MNSLLRLTLIMSAFFIITACGPRLQQVKNYVPPVTDNGLECLEKADRDRNQCELDNQSRLSNCHRKAEVDAEKLLAEQEREYAFQLEQYIDDERLYELAVIDYEEQKRLIRRDGELEYVRCSKDVELTRMAMFPACKELYDAAYRRANELPAPLAPLRPARPTYDVIVAGLKRQCNSVKQNCLTPYDQAYISCGGKIEYETICVANCD